MEHANPLRRSLAIVALCAFGLLYTFPYHPKIGNPNEKLRVYMSAAIAEEATYAVDTFRARWGWVNDAAIHDGSYYSVKAPGTSFLGVLPYWVYLQGARVVDAAPDLAVATWLLRVFSVALPMLGFLFFFHRWLARRSSRPWLVDAVTLGLALASPLYAYSVMFVSHAQAAASLFIAFALLDEAREQRTTTTTKAAVAGLCTAGVTFFEYPGVLVSVLLSLWALFALRPIARIGAFAGGALVPTALVMHFQWAAFGSPFSPGHKLLENKSFAAGHEVGLFGASFPTAEALFGLTFDPRQGLFPLAPWMLFALFGFGFLVQRESKWRVAGAIALSICVVKYLFVSSLNVWHAGWSVGPRYLAMIFPLVAWAALAGIERLVERRPRFAVALTVGTLASGLMASGIPSAYYPHIPVATQRMLPEVFFVAISHDFAPYNALNLAGVWGTLSTLPLFACFALVLAWVARRALLEERVEARVLAGAALAFVVTLVPVVAPSPVKTRGADHVLRNWSPDDKDDAARLAAEMKAAPTVEGLVALEAIYADEGREREARKAARDRLSLEGKLR